MSVSNKVILRGDDFIVFFNQKVQLSQSCKTLCNRMTWVFNGNRMVSVLRCRTILERITSGNRTASQFPVRNFSLGGFKISVFSIRIGKISLFLTPDADVRYVIILKKVRFSFSEAS